MDSINEESRVSEPKTRTQAPSEYSSKQNVIHIKQLVLACWSGRKWLAISTILFSIPALYIALTLPSIYTAEVTLAPVSQEEPSAFSGIAGQLGGIANLAGIKIGSSAIDKTTLAIEVLKSRDFLIEFIRRHDLAVQLVAAKRWDPATQTLILDKETYDPSKKLWTLESKSSQAGRPTDGQLYKLFIEDVLSISKSKDTGLIRISVSALSPFDAQEWASKLIRDLNQRMRQMDIMEAERSIEYLKEKVEKTTLNQMQDVFYELISQQTKAVMLASVREEYVLKTIDPAIVPEKKSKPNRAAIIALGVIIGVGIGLTIILLKLSFVVKPHHAAEHNKAPRTSPS